mmetsp:Transcript_65080/g.153140  ORF Transcript_65080/g.153140 Transcript_65080/m.153140 type:complete len:225 (+) Transcript_65080:515-1189(+)
MIMIVCLLMSAIRSSSIAAIFSEVATVALLWSVITWSSSLTALRTVSLLTVVAADTESPTSPRRCSTDLSSSMRRRTVVSCPASIFWASPPWEAETFCSRVCDSLDWRKRSCCVESNFCSRTLDELLTVSTSACRVLSWAPATLAFKWDWAADSWSSVVLWPSSFCRTVSWAESSLCNSTWQALTLCIIATWPKSMRWATESCVASREWFMFSSRNCSFAITVS